MLGQLDSDRRAVVADMEAGIGTLSRMPENALDVVVAVAEPTPKSLEVASRARDMALEGNVAPTVLVIANKVRHDDDLARIRAALGEPDVVIPEDLDVVRADVHGLSPVDVAPESAAVTRIAELAQRLTRPAEPVSAD